jgi:DNA-binding NarL/FixJ family response regulator
MAAMDDLTAEAQTASVRVLVVDDDAMVRAGLTMMLDGAEGLSIVGEAADGGEVPAAVARLRPDVVLMDIRMPGVDGVNATRRLRERSPAPEVIMLTTYDTDENIVAALRAGASGFLLKDTPPARIVAAVRRVAAGEPMFSPAVLRRMMTRVAGDPAREGARADLDRLSARERDVALAIARGQSNQDIATDLFMSVATVKAHVSHIFTKLGLSNRTQIAVLVHEAELDG